MGGEGADLGRRRALHQRRRTSSPTWATAPISIPASLAIRAAVAAKANITYKLLFNDAVAMTGGQHVDGPLIRRRDDPPAGRRRRARDRRRHRRAGEIPGDADFAPRRRPSRHRDELDAVQKELREATGRHRAHLRPDLRRREAPPPQARHYARSGPSASSSTNWSAKAAATARAASNCVSVEPLETEFGRKRKIDQSSCNKDFSCVNGFCPSFVTVRRRQACAGARRAGAATPDFDCRCPSLPALRRGAYNILIAGIGGTGVTTLGRDPGHGRASGRQRGARRST